METNDFWQALPPDFKLLVVPYLDYKSRCRLQKCSKNDKELVELCPVKLKSLKVELGFNTTAKLLFNGEIETKFYDSIDVINDFAMTFPHSGSMVEILEINGFAKGFDSETPRFIEKLTAIRKIRIKNLIFHINIFNDDQVFLKLIKATDEKVLEKLTIRHRMSRRCLDKLADLPHWKMLKKIGFGEIENPDIERFLHLVKIRFDVEKLPPKDLWKLVENFCTRPLPIGSYFDITINHDADVHLILELFHQKSIDVKNGPLSPRDAEKYVHTQRFTVLASINEKEPEKILILKMNNWSIYGFIRRA